MAFDVNAFRAKLAAQKTLPSAQAEEKKEEAAPQQEAAKPAAQLSLAERLAAAKNNKPTELEKPVLKETVPFTADNPIAEIQNKINELSDLEGESLSGAMAELKKALRENAAACDLLLDEDIGKLTIAYRRMVNEDVIQSKSDNKKKPKAVTIDKSLAELDFDAM